MNKENTIHMSTDEAISKYESFAGNDGIDVSVSRTDNPGIFSCRAAFDHAKYTLEADKMAEFLSDAMGCSVVIGG